MDSYFTKDDDKLKWKQGEIKTILSTCVFDVTSRHNVSSTNIEGDYIVMNARDWVVTIAEKDDCFLMVKQWRHGENKLSVEFPGGVVDKGEKPENAALRELEEETGFRAGKLLKLGSVNPNPALFSNHIHFFLAEDLIPTGQQHLDHDELINYMALPKDEVIAKMGSEEFPHALMGTALMMYLQYKIKNKSC